MSVIARAAEEYDALPAETVARLATAAAGGHHVLVRSKDPDLPASAARVVRALLPPLATTDVRDVRRLWRAAGLGRLTLTYPPLRHPLPNTSVSGLLGTADRPGELSLSHRGVLLIDDAALWLSAVLRALPSPLDRRSVNLGPAALGRKWPAAVTLLVAVECRCHRPPGTSVCRCVRSAVPGPLLARLSVFVDGDRPRHGGEVCARPAFEDVLAASWRASALRAATRAARRPDVDCRRLVVADGAAGVPGQLTTRSRSQLGELAFTVAALRRELAPDGLDVARALALHPMH